MMDMTMTSAATMVSSTAMLSSSSSMMMMDSMKMYFTTSTTTPLWSSRWAPSSVGQYAGTCVFLIIFAVISRFIGAARQSLEQRWHDAAMNRRYIIVADKDGGEGQMKSTRPKESDGTGVLTARGVDETVRIIQAKSRSKERTPWRLSTDLPRSLMFLVQSGVGYLL